MASPYDEEIIRLFVAKDRQQRLLFKLARPERWYEAISEMTNTIVFDPCCMTQLPKKPKLEELYLLLKARGAGDKAYLLTINQEEHGRIVPLHEALKRYIDRAYGAFVYCVEGQVGYYKADGWEGHFIIHKAVRGN